MSEIEEIFRPAHKLKDQELVEELQKRGHRVLLEQQADIDKQTTVPEVIDKSVFRLAVASDWHLGSRYQQLGHLRAFLQTAEQHRVDFILCPGDVLSGTPRLYRGKIYEDYVHGADAQMEYALNVIPEVEPPIYLISGNHDYSFYSESGINVVHTMCEQRDGWVHAGDLGTELNMGPLKMYVWHPDGGVAYARTYRLQKWIQERPPEHRPHIVIGGHFHVGAYLSRYSGVESFLAPCFQAQTPYLKRKGLTPEIGGIILEVTLDSKGMLRRLKHEWIKYPDWRADDY